MRFQNFTSEDSDRLRAIIRFCCPSNVSKFDIAFKNAGRFRGFSGRAYIGGCSRHDYSMALKTRTYLKRGIPYLVIKIPRADEITYPHITEFGGGYLKSVQFTRDEDVVHLVAHELRHLWQAKVKRGYRVWGARGQYSERDADAYAIRKVREWRRLTHDAPNAKNGMSSLS